MYASVLTNSRSDSDSMISSNDFYPRMLWAISGCKGVGLDCSDAKIIIKDGLPEKSIRSFQEIGTSGRCLNNYGSCPADSCHLILDMADHGHLFERFFSKSREQN